MSLKNKFEQYFSAISVYPTGSRYTCTPPVMDTDEDYLVLVEDFNKVYYKLISPFSDWEDCMPQGSPEFIQAYTDERQYGISWNAFRKGQINIMITGDMHWYLASVAATELCRKLNIQSKEQRIRIFRHLKYGEPVLLEDMP